MLFQISINQCKLYCLSISVYLFISSLSSISGLLEFSYDPITSSSIFAIHSSASLLTTFVLPKLLRTTSLFDIPFFQQFFTSFKKNLFLWSACLWLFFRASVSFVTYFSYPLMQFSYLFCLYFAKLSIYFNSFLMPFTLYSIFMK